MPQTRKRTPRAAEGTGDGARERTLVILPTFNERLNLEAITAGVRGQGCDVLVVDDNSPDGTGDLADALALADLRVDVLHRSGKLGLGTAYIAGLHHGVANGYDLLVTMDADGSHNPVHLPALIAAARRSHGVAIGSRTCRGAPSWAGSGIASRSPGPPTRMPAPSSASVSTTAPRGTAATPRRHRAHRSRPHRRRRLRLPHRDAASASTYAPPSPRSHPLRGPPRGRSKVSSSEIIESVTLVPRLRLRGRRALPISR